MIIARVKFGQSHAVASIGDRFKGKQTIDLACTPGIELSKANADRYHLFDRPAVEVTCATCRHSLGLDEEENAD